MRPDASENSQISPSTIVRAARAAGSHPHLASVLLQGRKSANIHANLGVIWEIPVNMRAVQLTAFGNPVEGLEYVDIPEPDAPGPNEVLIGVEFSPINPSDLMVARGKYAIRPRF